MSIFITIILFLLIILFIYYILLSKICNNIEYYTYGSKTTNNKTILIIGGIHGNEPAGSNAIVRLMNNINKNNINIKNKLILIPYANYCALQINKRTIPFIGDLNRKFPIDINYEENKLHPIIRKILLFVHEADFILDIHEGWGYYRELKGSIGSSIIPSNTQTSYDISEILYDNINETIVDNNKKFIILRDNINTNNERYGQFNKIKYSLSYYANLINKNYILIEISGKNDIQDINIRISQIKNIINTVLDYYDTY
jgi:hypothetical protein